jgi:hypothetical protein
MDLKRKKVDLESFDFTTHEAFQQFFAPISQVLVDKSKYESALNALAELVDNSRYCF